MKDDNADDIECRLEVISGITNNFIVCISKIQHMNTQSQLQWSDIRGEQLFLLSYLTGRTVMLITNC